MKREYWIISMFILLLGCSPVQKDQFKINGEITSYPVDILFLVYQDHETWIRDTIRVENGKFTYQKQLADTVRASLVSQDPDNGIQLDKGFIPGEAIPVFMQPGTVLEMSIDNQRWPELRMKGGTLNDDLMKIYAKIMPLNKKAFDLLRQAQVPGISEAESEKFLTQRIQLKKQVEMEQVDFVKENPASYTALYLFKGMRNSMTLEEYTQVFNRMSVQLKETILGHQIQEHIRIAMASAVGAMAPEFEKIDREGKLIRLSDFRGKYVLLDFWGSWCVPCRASHPHLKELEAQYAPKGLVVINIAQENGNNARERWLKAVEKDQLTWTQILNNEGKKECNVVEEFGITAFPTKILIDPEGKIIVRAVGVSEPIDQKLKEVF